MERKVRNYKNLHRWELLVFRQLQESPDMFEEMEYSPSSPQPVRKSGNAVTSTSGAGSSPGKDERETRQLLVSDFLPVKTFRL